MGKRLMIFLDDLNMPRMDQYGTQQPIALLKLLIDRKVGLLHCLAMLALLFANCQCLLGLATYMS